MAPTSPAVPAELRGRPFTLAEGRAAGLSTRGLDGPGLRRPTRGVRTTERLPSPADVLARCQELAAALPADAVFSHATGLDLLGIDRPRGLQRPGDVHVEVPHTTRRPRRHGVTSHSRRVTSGSEPVVLRSGLPVLPPVRLWTQLAAELDEVEVVVLGDALLRRRRARASAQELGRAVGRLAPGTRGLRRLRLACPCSAPGPTRARRRGCGWRSSRPGCPARWSTAPCWTTPAASWRCRT